ncbi:nucleolus and neural progenitor protein isoform X1 [Coregonus clupeaformis]|uniref:nucleolus and neural progenitor protein isoform X1 n=1 Tax=Coregonus clupeaformis TaxID=59861 RepID=UPI001BDFA763|nr:nucleolus and neural progenitor protein isoform X1 [Coregonus clupeaformis]
MEASMAEEPWNKVNIPFPSAVSTVHIPFGLSTGTYVKRVLEENEKVLKLLGSRVLQTEIRVLYELLYVLNNSLRQHKPFRILKQVEQCINRLKEMKLDAALLDLKQLCPKKMQRQLATETGQCDVPSQPMLEWLCLKVLGAARLMTCLLNHCTRAFILARQHLQSKEFILLNVVFTSMLSRLWVFFRGILGSLAPLYQHLLELLKEVSQAQAMAFLIDFTLPAGIAEFLGPSDSSWLKMQHSRAPRGLGEKGASKSSVLNRLFREEGEEGRKQALGGPSNRKSSKLDLGTAVLLQRTGDTGAVSGFDMKALLKRTHGGIPEVSIEEEQPSSLDAAVIGQKRKFLKQLKTATTFSNMAAHLEEVMQWCECRKLRQEKGRLTFLHLKCQRMKHLESEGCSVQGKLKSYKREVCWALSLRGAVPRTCQSLKTLWRRAHPRIRFQPFRTLFEPIRTAVCVNRKRSLRHKRRRRRSTLPDSPGGVATMTDDQSLSNEHSNQSRDPPDTPAQKPLGVNETDIDDIFAFIGF